MNKKLPIISLFIMSIISIMYWALKPKEELYEAKWNAPDTTLAITIDGEVSTTFPTTKAYEASVECTNGTGKVEWNGTKWVLTTSGITKGSTKCNAMFNKIPAPNGWYDAAKGTLLASLRDSNTLKTPLTTPGQEVSAYTLDDITDTLIRSVGSTEQTYYITYGTGWEANGVNFNLTAATVTSDTYANSYSSLVGKYLPYSYLSSSGSSTAGTMKTTTNLRSVYYVVSATQKSFTYKEITSNKNTTEAVLASTEDDYGTSYYFRGAVKNNYVQFANKCWRIVRITGNGSIKIILYNDNIFGKDSPCSVSNNDSYAAFAHSDNTSKYATYNITYGGNKSNDNANIGLMYGTTGASNYAATHENINKSETLTSLEEWYTNNLIFYSDKLADTIWCNDKSTSSGLGYGRVNTTSYGAVGRLTITKTPSFVCPNDNNGGKLSKFTVSDTINGNGNLSYKIGLITADEMAFAGHIIGNTAKTYLVGNTSWGWISLSPASFDYLKAIDMSIFTAYRLSADGVIANGFGDSSEYFNLRPTIALISSITISGGSGTSEDPYVVN